MMTIKMELWYDPFQTMQKGHGPRNIYCESKC